MYVAESDSISVELYVWLHSLVRVRESVKSIVTLLDWEEESVTVGEGERDHVVVMVSVSLAISLADSDMLSDRELSSLSLTVEVQNPVILSDTVGSSERLIVTDPLRDMESDADVSFVRVPAVRLPVCSAVNDGLMSFVVEADKDSVPRERLGVTGVTEVLRDHDSVRDFGCCVTESEVDKVPLDRERDTVRSRLNDCVTEAEADKERDTLASLLNESLAEAVGSELKVSDRVSSRDADAPVPVHVALLLACIVRVALPSFDIDPERVTDPDGDFVTVGSCEKVRLGVFDSFSVMVRLASNEIDSVEDCE